MSKRGETRLHAIGQELDRQKLHEKDKSMQDKKRGMRQAELLLAMQQKKAATDGNPIGGKDKYI